MWNCCSIQLRGSGSWISIDFGKESEHFVTNISPINNKISWFLLKTKISNNDLQFDWRLDARIGTASRHSISNPKEIDFVTPSKIFPISVGTTFNPSNFCSFSFNKHTISCSSWLWTIKTFELGLDYGKRKKNRLSLNEWMNK